MSNTSLTQLLLLLPPMLLALTVHECAHAWTADRLGDPTARAMGRVTLNPLKHLDPIGTLALIFSGMFGWAKPVPVNPRNFKNPTRDMMWVALAGPLSNLCMAVTFAIIFKVMILFVGNSASSGIAFPLLSMVFRGIIINIALGVFNMIPVPPLDGSKVLYHFLPYEQAVAYSKFEKYGFIVLILLIMSGAVGTIIGPVVRVSVGLLTGGI